MTDGHRPHLDLEAHCACGTVSVRLLGRVHSMLLCSCLDCQKATGTGHSSVAMVDASAVTIAGPTQSFKRPADSGATFTRTFCPTCGTPLSGASSRAPGILLLPVGLFGAETDWFVPNQLIFARSHHDWDLVPADLPQHAKYRETARP